MSDLIGNQDCLFSHANAQMSRVIVLAMLHVFFYEFHTGI